MSGTESVSVVIITKNTKEMLKGLLCSIKNDISLQPFIKELVVVDNASTDGTDTMITHDFPEVLLIKNSENKGFAAAANTGIAHTTGHYILLLNSDTIIIKGEIFKMLEFMAAQKDVGICGPQLVYDNMKPQRSFAYRPNMIIEFIPKSVLEFFLPSRYANKNRIYTAPVDVDSLIGAALMISRNAFNVTGGFDERFFFFLEETDLCLRVRENGLRIVFLPDVKIVHFQGKTVKQSWINGRIEYNISLHKFIKKHHSYLYYAAFNLIRFLKCLLIIVTYCIVPCMLCSEKQRVKYMYYLRLFAWYMKLCPNKGGLRPNFQEQK